jgi:predicted Fe-S protein YdhL (DUF1289 family)
MSRGLYLRSLERRPVWRAATHEEQSARSGLYVNIPSPCTGACTLDPVHRRCIGCLRTIEEIAAWPEAAAAERLLIVQRLRERRRVLGRTSEADSRPRRRQRKLAEPAS